MCDRLFLPRSAVGSYDSFALFVPTANMLDSLCTVLGIDCVVI